MRKDLRILSPLWEDRVDDQAEDSLSPIVGNLGSIARGNETNISDNDNFTEVLSKSQKKRNKKSKRLAQKADRIQAQGRAGDLVSQ